MNKTYLLIFALAIKSSLGLACSLNLYDRVLLVRGDINRGIIKDTDCSKEIQEKLVQKLNNQKGMIFTGNMAFPETLIIPSKILISSLKEYVNSKTPQKIHLTALMPNFKDNAIYTDQNKLSFECLSCENHSESFENIIVAGKKYPIYMKYKKMKKALVAKENISGHRKLTADLFEYKFVPISDNKQAFSFNKDIKYYKNFRPIRKGSPLLEKNVFKRDIIKYGNSVKCIINKNGLALELQAVARSNGKINELIKIINPQTKKILTATVIGNNIVKVDI